MTGTTIIVKVVAFFYKLPLGSMRLLGDEGFAHFTVAYNIYGFILTLATAGFPVALSRMISVADAKGRPAQVQRIFRVALGVLAGIGAFFTLIMWGFNRPLAAMMGDREAALSIAALAPAVLIVCAASAYRGYCQGRGNMIPTAFGQVIEEVGKLAVGLTLAYLIVSRRHDLAAGSAGAIFGVTAGALGALTYMALYKRRNYPDRTYGAGDAPDSRASIVREFLRIGIPIAVGASVLSLINLLDNALCLNRLQSAARFLPQEAHTLYGVYGKAQTLFNLPAAFITPLTISIVPAISRALAQRDLKTAAAVSEDSMRISSVVSIPMGVGLAVLSGPIMRLLYPGSHAAGPDLLAIMGVASFFVCIVLLENAILQASGKEKLTMVTLIVGGIVKIVINWFLVARPEINIYGAPVGTLISYLVMAVMNYAFMSRELSHRPRLLRVFGGPVLSSAIMGLTAWAVFGVCSRLIPARGSLGLALSLGLAILAAVIVYVAAAILSRSITKEDMRLIPGGEKIAKLLHMQ
jgi:stage V sporulation protein B